MLFRVFALLLHQVLYYLSGLTCTDDNFIQKAGAQRAAALRGVVLVAPDTSPRGAGVPGEAREIMGNCVVRFGPQRRNSRVLEKAANEN